MVDYVKRNWTPANCSYQPEGFERGCHNTYHFDDVAIQRDRFDRSFQGTNAHDLVAAIGAAVAVLQDKPIPGSFPFSFKDKKEAPIYTTDGDSVVCNLKYKEGVYDTTVKSVEPSNVSQLDSVEYVPDLVRVGKALAKEVRPEHFALERFGRFY